MEIASSSYPSFKACVDKAMCLSWKAGIAPCEAACPLGINVEGYVKAIAEGKLAEAAKIIREKCPLPGICGRVCHRPCEFECKRGKIDQPVSIRALKRFAADYEDTANRLKPVEKLRPNDVAIIGSGPAGLVAAHDCARLGYGVVIYEALPVAGGMLTTAIPEFILPQKVVEADIKRIEELGVEIRTNVRIGKDLLIEDIRHQGFRAILIAIGAQNGIQLRLTGIDADHILYALPLLREIKLGQRRSLQGKVIVIGGGNVAVDAARTALRLGATEVHMFCLESRENMPAFEWEINLAQDEGVKIHNSQAPQGFRAAEGNACGIDFRTVAHSERDNEERFTWTLAEGPDSESRTEADWVIIAIGQAVDLSGMTGPDLGLNVGHRGELIVDRDTMATNVPGIFAAGDVVEVAGTVTGSMELGRKAAASIDKYLRGIDLRKGLTAAVEPDVKGAAVLPQGIPFQEREKTRTQPAMTASHNFEEVDLGFTSEQAVREAERCLRCKTCHRCTDGWECIAILAVENRGAESPCIDRRMCAGCGVCIRRCPYESIYEETSE